MCEIKVNSKDGDNEMTIALSTGRNIMWKKKLVANSSTHV